jgi:tetratricopeptide (TPR) repeat protein
MYHCRFKLIARLLPILGAAAVVTGLITTPSRPEDILPRGGTDVEKEINICISAKDNPDARVSACTVLLQAEPPGVTPKRAIILTSRALASRAKNDFSRADADLTEAIRIDEAFAPAYEARGDLLRDENECARAILDFGQVIKLDPNRAPAYFGRGTCYLVVGDTGRALTDFDEILRLDINNVHHLALPSSLLKARVESAIQDYEHAVTDFSLAIRFDPISPKPYLDRGDAFSANGDYDKALSDYDEALKLDEKNAAGFAVAALAAKANLCATQGDTACAIDALSAAIGFDPHSASHYIARAALWNSKGDVEHTLADLDEAINTDPKSAVAYISRGDFYRSRSDYSRADVDYSQAIELQPQDLTAYGSRALTRFYRADFDNAAIDFKKVFDAQPNAYSVLWLYLSRARNNRRDARGELEGLVGKIKETNWPYPIALLFVDKKSMEEVQSAVAAPDEKCEVQFYTGEWHLLRGEHAEAGKALKAAADLCAKDVAEYDGAVAELKRFKP